MVIPFVIYPLFWARIEDDVTCRQLEQWHTAKKVIKWMLNV